jgi:uncharacterized RDD family membrane protein YckC
MSPEHYRYDTFTARIGALIIDGLIVILPTVVLQIVIDQAAIFWMSYLFSLITTIAVWCYYILAHGLYGRTIGKKQQVLRVVDSETEQPITMLQAVKRELLNIIAGILSLGAAAVVDFTPLAETTISAISVMTMIMYSGILVAEIAVCLNSPKRRALHDLIGGTVVVRDNVSADAILT